MAYLQRAVHRRRTILSAEFFWLIVVIAAGTTTAWWTAQGAVVNLSAITTAVSVLGLNETTGKSRPVGYSPQRADATTQEASVLAPHCQPGQAPSFALGMSQLKQQLGATMGDPVECEHATSPFGDTVQQTTTGLAAYDALTNTVSFTDGWHHWAYTPRGFVSWEGTDSQPPLANDQRAG
jgi:hypothetical protein